MGASDIRKVLVDKANELACMGVSSLSLFGSAAKGRSGQGSDLDVLVEFNEPAKFDKVSDLREFLEREFGVPIDLVTVRALKPALRVEILLEAIKVA